MSANKIIIDLHLPEYWDRLYNLLQAKMKRTPFEINRFDLDIEITGEGGNAYSNIITTSKESGNIPIMVLPISHCVLNIDQYNLKIVGPAFKTINDVYLVRRKNCGTRPDSLIIGVREKELTTSNISRVVFNHIYEDRFFFYDVREKMYEHAHANISTKIRHKAYFTPEDRLKGLLKEELDASIFMGEELLDKRIYNDDNFIVAANLNRIICNLFNVQKFPRTVFATFEDYIENIEPIESFFNVYNDVVEKTFINREYRHYETFHYPESQFHCLTGKLSNLDDVNTLVMFSKEIADKSFEGDRYKWTGRNEGLNGNDFIWWDDINHLYKMSEFIQLLKEIDILKVFSAGLIDRERNIISDQLTVFHDLAQNEIEEKHEQFKIDDLVGFIKDLELESRYKQMLKNYILEKWKDYCYVSPSL